jgi:hypothetical protein
MKKLLFLLSMAALLPFFFITVSVTSCNQTKKGTVDTSGIKQTDTTKGPCATSFRNFIGTHFYELSLSKTKYEDLKAYHGASGKKLVVQFYFNVAAENSPSLIAYAAKANNKFKKGTSTLSYLLTNTGVSRLIIPDEFVLGDQQVSFSDIDNDLVSRVPAGTDYVLIFTPVKDGAEKNIYYTICVKFKRNGVDVIECGGDAGTPTQPSPPADANP